MMIRSCEKKILALLLTAVMLLGISLAEAGSALLGASDEAAATSGTGHAQSPESVRFGRILGEESAKSNKGLSAVSWPVMTINRSPCVE